ncbi:MAG: hypothetical protein D6E12_18220 [Desulfovibrio sp.]|nr:MAG: hypothetical protein D6E12_18220 [Desulfovibrio sp.]
MKVFSRKYLLALAVAVWAMLSLALAQDPSPVGWVQAAEGEVLITSPGQTPRAAERNMPVYNRDEIATSQDASVQIVFMDDCLVSLGENSRMQLSHISFDQTAPQQALFDVDFLQGAFGVVSGRIAEENPEAFQVDSPLAFIGIRGTEFVSLVEAGQETHALFTGGPVLVTTAGQGDSSAVSNRERMCAKLAQARVVYADAHAILQRNGDFRRKSIVAALNQEAEDLMAAYGCPTP